MRSLIILRAFVLLLVFSPSAASIFGQPSAREVPLVLTVTDDKGGVAAGLKRDWFSILEKDSQLQITEFETSEEPASVAILVDLSNSVPGYSKGDFIFIVSQFMRMSNPKNDYLIIGFNKAVMVVTDWGNDPLYVEKELKNAAQQEATYGTALFDACSAALTKLGSSRNVVRAVLLLSDGKDTASKISFNKLRDQLRESPVIMYSIGVTPRGSLALSPEAQGILDELSEVTGGRSYYLSSDKERLAVCELISLQLRHHYRIRFRPLLPMPDNKWHSIKVKLTLPQKDDKGRKVDKLSVRSRQGYYDR